MRRYSLALCATCLGCASSVGPQAPARSPAAAQWFDRARASYRGADFDDAREAARQAMSAAPSDPEIRELAARVALVRLDFNEALRLTEGLTSTEAHSIRGRASWFTGDLEHAADELEAMLSDPKVKDPWAREVASLARRGAGRHPFEMEGGLVASVEMPAAIDRVSLGSASVVPCELDGERILALVATGSSEVLVDSSSRHESAWVSLRFDRVEVKDVPALSQDLSALTRQLGVPIKALLGAQLLRHTHATVDRRGDQFVVRRLDASPPPDANRVPLFYLRGGGMLLRAGVTSHDEAQIPLMVDTSRLFPLLLRDAAWKSAGVDVRSLSPVPDLPNVKRGSVPMLRIGGFDVTKTPALEGAEMGGAEMGAFGEGLDVDLGGIIGAELLAFFRLTFADDGRFMWIEPDPSLGGSGPSSRTSAVGSTAPTPPAETPAPSASPAQVLTPRPTGQRDQ